MANGLYEKGREKFARGQINWDSDNIKCVLIDTGAYTVNLALHEFLSDIAVGARLATSANFTGKTSTNGACDADDVTWPTVTATSGEAVAVYKDTGTDSSSPLICYVDTATGLPVIPNGGDIIVIWDNGTFKIFKL